MAWQDSYREASFRGVPFRVARHEEGGGRTGRTHRGYRWPKPDAEDAGEKAGKYRVEAYIIDRDYFGPRDALRAALRQEGPGQLVHPYLGTLHVIARDWTLRESTDAGNRASFSIQFEEAGLNQFPSDDVNTSGDLAAKATDAITAIQDAFEDAFEAASFQYLVDQAVVVQAVITDQVEAALGALSEIEGDLDRFRVDLDTLVAGAATLALTPSTLAGDLVSVVQELAALPASAGEAHTALLSLGRLDPTLDPIPATTPMRKQHAANEAALLGLARRAAVIEACRNLTAQTFEAREQAVAARDELAEVLDAEIIAAGNNGDDAAIVQLSDVLAAMSAHLKAQGATLASLTEVEYLRTLPAAVVAHRLYADGTRDLEIVDRNHIEHPGYVPGGVTLMVLD